MADTQNVNSEIAMSEAHVLSADSLLITDPGVQEPGVDGNEVTEDEILQQALEEASNSDGVVQIQLTDAHGDNSIVNSVVTGEEFTGDLADDSTVIFEDGTYAVVDNSGGRENLTYTIVNTSGSGNGVVYTPVDSTSPGDQTFETSSGLQGGYATPSIVQTESLDTIVESNSNSNTQHSFADQDSNLSSNSGTCITIPAGNGIPGSSGAKGISVRLVSSSDTNNAPLGSSQNPIRIVQQGNHYTPMQQLSTDQLQQIMQVLQQQQVAKNTSDEGSSILFNPQTNTRIVYRVIYPSELHKGTSQGAQTRTVMIGQRRPYRKRTKEEEDEDKLDGPELSKEEKEERKKHRPRTRSGRISKPPKHMVKDYKHIHVLDMDEEEAADDSDGGYSDFKYSEDEHEADPSADDKEDIPYENMTATGTARPKKYQCSICEKAYIGQAGLNRHYRLNPDHGTPVDEDGATEGSGFYHPSQNGTGNISEDSNTQDSTSSTPPNSTKARTTSYYYQKGYRGRRSSSQSYLNKRKHNLREAVRQSSDEDLMEIVLPRLAKVITLWEFLMMKVEKGRPLRPQVDEVYSEYAALTRQVQKMCKSFLKPAKEEEDKTDSKQEKLKITEPGIAQALGLNVGTYDIQDDIAALSSVNFVTVDAKTGKVLTPVKRTGDSFTVSPKKQKLDPAVYVSASESSVLQKQKPSVSTIQTSRNSITVVHPSSVNVGSQVQTSSNSSSGLSSHSPSVVKPTVIYPTLTQQAGKSTISSSKTVVQPGSRVVKISAANGTHTVPSSVMSNNPNLTSVLTSPNTSAITIRSAADVGNTGGVSILSPNLKTMQTKNVNSVTREIPSVGVSSPKPGTKVIRIVSSDVGLLNSLGSMNSNELLSMISGGSLQIPVSSTDSGGSRVITIPAEVASQSKVNNPNSEEETDNSQLVKEDQSGLVNNAIHVLNSSTQSNTQDLQEADDGCDSFVATDLLSSEVGDVEQTDQQEEGDSVADSLMSDHNQVIHDIVNSSDQQLDSENGTEMVQLVDPEESGGTPDDAASVSQVIAASNIYQTPEGIIIIQKEDGSTIQLQGAEGEPIPLETVQALLAMDTEGQILQGVDGMEAVQQ